MNKRGYFFSVDAFVAFIIVLGVVIFVRPVVQPVVYEVHTQDDLLQVLSDIQIGELNNSYVLNLIANGSITKLNNSVLEQLGEYYAFNDPQGENLLKSIFASLDLDSGLALYFDDTLVGNSSEVNFSEARSIKTSRQIISGIGGGVNASSGFSSRASLFLENKIKYFYFGGYVGDGTITMNIGDNVSGVSVEGEFSRDFDIYINDVYAASYTPTVGVPEEIDLLAHTDKFLMGANNISFRSVNSTLSIAGGFLRVVYNSSDFEVQEKVLPGILGFINLYDSLYIPGNLTSMDIYLHYDSIYDIFVSLGDDILYTGNSSGETTVTLPDSNLSTFLDYSLLSQTTVPFRIGYVNVSGIINDIVVAYVVSVTDLSGSMSEHEVSCGGTNQIMDCARSANNVLIDIMLNYSRNLVGLVGYESSAKESDFHTLSNDTVSLKNVVSDEWNANGATCICCGINRAAIAFIEKFEAANNGGYVTSRISQTSDDVEERSNGNMESLSSSDLELVQESSIQQVGMRFQDIDIAQGKTILSAYIEFEADETDTTTTHLSFSAEDVDDAATFSSSKFSVSSRTKTSSIVTWSNVPSWSTVSEKHQTLDLSVVIQEIIDRPGWSSGNSIAIIVNGTGKRVAESYNGESENAPLLVITYAPGSATCGDSIIDVGEECDDGNTNNNDACTNYCTLPVCGDGLLFNESGGGETCDDGGVCTGDGSTSCFFDSECLVVGGTCEAVSLDGCDNSCQLEARSDVMIVMSDGFANVECVQQGVTADLNGNGKADDAGDDAIQAACDAYNDYGIEVYAVGFGDGADQNTLQDIASCGHGNYYYNDVEDLAEKYVDIAEDILSASYEEQTVVGNGVNTILYPDSKISFAYESDTPYGLRITSETDDFLNSISQGNVTIPLDSVPYDVGVVSYSGPQWTNLVEIYNTVTGLWDVVFNLSEYNSTYVALGDPYVVNIPIDKIVTGENSIRVSLGANSTDSSGGSPYNKIVYSIIKNFSEYSPVLPVAEGCIWNIEFEDLTNETMLFPPTYNGSKMCYYAEDGYFFPGNNVILGNANDAINVAILNLFETLDLNSNQRIETKFSDGDMSFSSIQIEGLPFTFETEVQARSWR